MGFFSRQPRDGSAPAVASDGQDRAAHAGNVPYSMATRPTLGKWLKYTWLDILTCAAMGAIGLGVSYSWLTSLTEPRS